MAERGVWWTRAQPVLGALLLAIGWILVLVPLAFVLADIAGLDRYFATAFAAMSFAPYVVVPALVVILVATMTHHRGLAIVALLTCAAHLLLLPPHLTHDRPAAAEASRQEVRVVTSNLHASSTDPDGAAAAILATEPDVLFVQELTPELERSLAAAGLWAVLPHQRAEPRIGTAGSGIYSRFPLEDTGVMSSAGQRYSTATISVGTTSVQVISVHTTQPLAGLDDLESQLHQLGELADRSEGPLIYAGDYNSGNPHSVFRDLLDDSRLRDAADSVGNGLSRSWPVGRRLPPFVLLDHVLVSDDVGVVDTHEVDVPGSDHRAVVATLLVP